MIKTTTKRPTTNVEDQNDKLETKANKTKKHDKHRRTTIDDTRSQTESTRNQGAQETKMRLTTQRTRGDGHHNEGKAKDR